jgi:hypothetical protein
MYIELWNIGGKKMKCEDCKDWRPITNQLGTCRKKFKIFNTTEQFQTSSTHQCDFIELSKKETLDYIENRLTYLQGEYRHFINVGDTLQAELTKIDINAYKGLKMDIENRRG